MPRDVVDLIQQIKQANDIVDVIRSYLPIQPAGKRFKCLCPFHNDKNPSLIIDPQYQNFKCWACQACGDVIEFVQKMERVDFLQARSILARRANIPLEDGRGTGGKLRLYSVLQWATEQYQQEFLNGAAGERARRYMGERRLAGATVRQFGIGYAPPDYGWLEQRAQRDGIDRELLIETGLLGRRDDSASTWDKFRDRIMFPIRDVQGRTVGFGGRILPDSPLAARSPKYYNTADTPLFAKSDHIYGIDLARAAATAEQSLTVVEGYTDVMAAHQAGITNVVATMGTALNERHLTQLRRYVPRIVLVYDADEGGQKGIDLALELFAQHDVELSVAALPPETDPADLLTGPNGAAEFRRVLASAQNALDFKLDSLLQKADDSPESMRRMMDAVLGILALAPPVPNEATRMKRELIFTRLSRRLGIELSTIRARMRELQALRARSAASRTSQPGAAAASQADNPAVSQVGALAARREDAAAPPPTVAPAGSAQAVLERQLLQVLLAEPALTAAAQAKIQPAAISHPGLRRLLQELYALLDEQAPAGLDGLRIRLLDRPDLVEAAFHLLEVGRQIPERPVYLQKVLEGFATMQAKALTRAIRQQLLAAGQDDEAALELLRRLP